jgi:hypothetical protein
MREFMLNTFEGEEKLKELSMRKQRHIKKKHAM